MGIKEKTASFFFSNMQLMYICFMKWEDNSLVLPSAPPINDASDVTNVTLALRTLGNFDFEGHSLTQFVRHCAEHYLASEHKDIRMEAVITCARLLSPLLQVFI